MRRHLQSEVWGQRITKNVLNSKKYLPKAGSTTARYACLHHPCAFTDSLHSNLAGIEWHAAHPDRTNAEYTVYWKSVKHGPEGKVKCSAEVQLTRGADTRAEMGYVIKGSWKRYVLKPNAVALCSDRMNTEKEKVRM